MIKISNSFNYLWRACNQAGTVLSRLCLLIPDGRYGPPIPEVRYYYW